MITRLGLANLVTLSESSYDSTKGELTITVIKPGMSKNKRDYPASMLKRDRGIFEGAKMFANHQTEAQQKAQPEGDVNNWVAQVKNVWAEQDGTLKAKAVVIDPQFKTKLDKLNENGMLSQMGVSIRAIGTAKESDQSGCKVVESLIACRSVDFVTYAGAGGQVEAMESAQFSDFDVDVIDEAALRARRPDLVTLIENSREEKLMKTELEQMTEANAALTASIAALTAEKATLTASNVAIAAEVATLKTKMTEAETIVMKTASAGELAKLLSESKLPTVSQDRIKKQFADATKVEGMKEAIDAEVEYVKSLGVQKTTKNLGAGANDENTEADKTKRQANLVESYKLLGMSEAKAKLAAGVE